MGITIHFSGRIDHLNLINELKEELVDISKIMKWKFEILGQKSPDSQTNHLNENRNIEKTIDNLFLDGICIILHPRAEPLFICINSEGSLTDPIHIMLVNEGALNNDHPGSFIKTQFAPADIHICVINLLKYLKKKYISNLEVFDEGGYWESGDKDLLLHSVDRIDKAMDILEDYLLKIDKNKVKDLSYDKLADLIEERLKKGFNNN